MKCYSYLPVLESGCALLVKLRLPDDGALLLGDGDALLIPDLPGLGHQDRVALDIRHGGAHLLLLRLHDCLHDGVGNSAALPVRTVLAVLPGAGLHGDGALLGGNVLALLVLHRGALLPAHRLALLLLLSAEGRAALLLLSGGAIPLLSGRALPVELVVALVLRGVHQLGAAHSLRRLGAGADVARGALLILDVVALATLLRLAHSLAFGLVEAELASGGGAALQLAVLLVGVVTCWDFRAGGGCSLAGRGQCCSGFFGEIVFHVGSRLGSLILVYPMLWQRLRFLGMGTQVGSRSRASTDQSAK